MSYMRTRAGAVIEVCGPRVYDLPGYYLDAIIKLRDERLIVKRAYDVAHAQRARVRLAKRKEALR